MRGLTNSIHISTILDSFYHVTLNDFEIEFGLREILVICHFNP